MAGQLTIDTLKASSGVLATQNGMTGICKAWVRYSGTTQTINSSFNVSSVTYIGTGQYNVNMTTAMPSANYAVVAVGNSWAMQASVVSASVFQLGPYRTDTQAYYNIDAACGAVFAA